LTNQKQEVSQEDRIVFFFEILKAMELETFYKAESIITYGEIGDKFYIILAGNVNIYIKRGDTEI